MIGKKGWEYLTKQPKGLNEARFLSSPQQNFLQFFNISNKKVKKNQPPPQVCTLVIFWVWVFTGKG